MSFRSPNNEAAVPAKKKVLIVEDSEFVHQIYRVAFRKLGDFELLHANDGAEGLTALDRSGPVDLVIVDLNMPVMDGLTFIRELRTRPGYAGTHVMVCSTDGTDPRLREQIARSAQSYLKKPFSLDQILAQLATILPAAERVKA